MQPVYDPRGAVGAEKKALAPRVRSLEGLRLGFLDNTKWNANKLLRGAASGSGRGGALRRGELLP